MPKIFVEYVGMGDSDKPRDYPYSTAERTDLVEEIWRHLGVSSTIAVAFDFSSLVVLEHLARLLERPIAAPKIDGAFIFNGGLFEQRLGKRGLTIVRLPGGHLTTNERPQALARLIDDFTPSVETRERYLTLQPPQSA